jgi:hypothetical protein
VACGAKYAGGLHFWSTGTLVPKDAALSIERIFNRINHPEEYWEPLLAGAACARAGIVVTVGKEFEFQYSFRPLGKADALSVMVLDFYRSFPYVAIMGKPGTNPSRMRLPF